MLKEMKRKEMICLNIKKNSPFVSQNIVGMNLLKVLIKLEIFLTQIFWFRKTIFLILGFMFTLIIYKMNNLFIFTAFVKDI